VETKRKRKGIEMALCNGSEFSFYDLDGYSVENEAWISTHCVSNRLKFGVFLFYIASYVLILVAFIGLGIKELTKDKKKRKLSLKQQLIFLSLLGATCNLIKMVLFLYGVNNRWKYLLFPIPFVVIFYLGCAIGIAWFRTVRGISDFGHQDKKMVARENRKFTYFLTYIVLGDLIFLCVGPIASFSDPWVLNWLYSFGFAHQGVVALSITCFMYYHGRDLLKELTRTQENNENIIKKEDNVGPIITSIRRLLLILQVYVFPIFCTLAIGPIWMGVTSSATNPGMEYSFYLQFFVIESMQVLIYPSSIYALLFTSLIQTSRKSSTERSSNENINSFGTKVEEMVAASN